MIYILDTDVFSIAEWSDSREYQRLHARVLELGEEDELATTIVTYEEQTRGWLAYVAKSGDLSHQIKAYSRLKKHLNAYQSFTILDFDAAATEKFEQLRALKIRIGVCDLKIAAIALAQDAVLLSRNLKDFGKIAGLRVEDWTST